jgi:hypothetical protein
VELEDKKLEKKFCSIFFYIWGMDHFPGASSKAVFIIYVLYEAIKCILSSFVFKASVKCSLYRPGVAQRVGRGIALLFHDRGTRRGCGVSSTPRPHFTPGKDPVPIVQEAGWAQGPVWTGAENPVLTGIRSRTVQPVFSRYTD